MTPYPIPGAYTIQTALRGHVCRCTGCCRLCGNCRTAPWHPGTCETVSDLRRTERRVVTDELLRLRVRGFVEAGR